ncbi:MAG: DMT family transporter [Nannocystis sp.]|nr:DMT family transporter [Nannocystis sp.]MBA3546149.1 DMT family transporter [Nannocystis sp.]
MPPAHLVLVVLISLAWGGNFLASAVALLSLPPFLYTALRLAMVLVILAPWLRAPAPGHWPRLVAVALLNGSLHFGINFWALRAAGDLSSVAIGLQSHVPISVILSVWLLGERISRTTAIAVALAFVGVLVMGLDPTVADQPLALALCLLAAFALALGSTLMRRLAGVGVFSLQAWGAVLGIPLMLAVSAVLEGDPRVHLAAAPLVAYGGAAYSAIAASILGHGGYYWLVQRHGVSPVSPYTLLTPLFAVLLGVLVWGDRPGPRLAIGGALVLGGVLLIALRRRAPPPR